MKKRNLSDVRKKSLPEIDKMIVDKRALRNTTLVNMSAGKEKNLKKASALKQDIAQLMTIRREK